MAATDTILYSAAWAKRVDMAGYSDFSQYYDALMSGVDYSRRAEYLLAILEYLGHRPGLALDLACGTGSLTLELYRRGVDVYGVDASAEMLSQAREKCMNAGANILFLRQRMQDLDLYGTVNTVFCTLDSINHLQGADEVRRAFQKVSLFLEPGGYFVFDMNTLYKHEMVLGNHSFVYDTPQGYCVWQNRFIAGTGRVDISLDFFERDGKVYRRSREHFSEFAYPMEQVKALLREGGFSKIHMFQEMSMEPPVKDSQRVVIAAGKEG